ncbi:MAG: oligosaccharide flippase family protein, partial [Chlamydiota bacterium]
ILSQLGVTALLSRGLSGEAFGMCAIFAHIMLMVGLFDGGIGGGGLRNTLSTCQLKDDQKKVFLSSFYFIGLIYLLLALIYALFIQHYLHHLFVLQDVHLFNQLKTIGWVFVISIIIKVPFSIYASGFYAFEEDDKKALIDIIESVALVLVLGLATIFHQDFLVGFAGYYLTLSLMSCLGFGWFLKKRNWKLKKFSWTTIYKSIQPLFKIHRAFWIQNLLSLALFSFSPYLLMRFLNLEKVGEYTLIYRACCLFLGIHFSLLNPLWASYTKAFYNKNFMWIEKTLRQSLKLTILLFGLAALGLIFFYQPILFLWSGKQIICHKIVVLYAIWMIFYALINCFSIFLNSVNLIQKQSLALLIGSSSNILLGVFFSKIWSVEGVVLASIISLLPLFFSNLIEILQLKKKVLSEQRSSY